jgi:CO/xanthine dehydrogenase Mo-binding subunit
VESPFIVLMGLIANAVFDATGVRFFRLPLTAERVRVACAKAKESTAKPG